ncbi:MAG TPA: hypothetical protein ENN17_06650 [bacterium]|nr:hypothetical protein [bacterium]
MKCRTGVLTLIAVIILSCSSKGKEFEKHNRLAQMYASSDSLEKAIEEWQLAIQADPNNKLSPAVINNIMNAKNKLNEQNEYNKAICQKNMSAIESAACIGYAQNAIAGDARYPTKNEIISSGIIDEFPKCPSGGTYKYDSKEGIVQCSIHNR